MKIKIPFVLHDPIIWKFFFSTNAKLEKMVGWEIEQLDYKTNFDNNKSILNFFGKTWR
jgi:hypothetical protein